MEKTTKRVNYEFKDRRYEIRIISYSFYEALMGAEGRINFYIKDTIDGTEGKLSCYCRDRYGWNWYSNKPNIDILVDEIRKYISDLVD